MSAEEKKHKRIPRSLKKSIRNIVPKNTVI